MPEAWLKVVRCRQQFSWSCVPACLRMALSAFDVAVEELELCRLSGSTPFAGTGVEGVRVVTAYGLQVGVGASTLPELATAIEMGQCPIVFLSTGPLEYWTVDDAHAVVVVSVQSDAVLLDAPAFEEAPQRTSRAGFRQAWAATGHLAAIVSRPSSPQGADPS